MYRKKQDIPEITLYRRDLKYKKILQRQTPVLPSAFILSMRGGMKKREHLIRESCAAFSKT